MTKILSGTYPTGYTIPDPSTYSSFSITATGYISGAGLSAPAGSYTTSGVYSIINAGRIKGSSIGVYLEGSGSVTNGSNGNTAPSIYGQLTGIKIHGAGTVSNFGAIRAAAEGLGPAVYLSGGGTVTNGSGGDTAALLQGGLGVWIRNATGSVTNFGTVVATSSGVSPGIYLLNGGAVTNGSYADTLAAVRGVAGVYIRNAPGTVTNFGSIVATGPYRGAYLDGGGAITNGTAIDSTALIRGSDAVFVRGGAGTVTNFGIIEGVKPGADGVYLGKGGSVTNGSGTDRAAVVEGFRGVVVEGAAASVRNFGTIQAMGGVAGYYGISLDAGGAAVNGSVSDRTALIQGYGGLRLNGAGASSNFGVIRGVGGVNTCGVDVSSASLANGAKNDTSALIEGYVGALVHGTGVLTNYGSISGLGGVAAELLSPTASLVVEAGSSFQGQVLGGGGTLELANGTGTLTGLLMGGNVTVSGSMATTTFGNFATVKIDAGASFALAGSGGTIAAGQSLIDAGALSGAGTLAITGGSATFNAGASLTIANVALSGSSKATVNTNITYAGKWTQSAGTLTVGSGATMSFTGPADSFAGTLANAGVVGIIGVTATIGAGGLNLTGTGHVLMTDSAMSEITGATAATTLTVGQVLEGAGKLGAGKLTLTVQAAGVIAAVGSNALTIDTGAATIVNAGIIETVGTTGATVVSAINNSGRLEAFTGVLTIDGVVTGTGTGQVNKGTLKFASTSTFNQNVTFAGTGGTLELAHGRTYSGTISGFSTTGGTFLDLDDIAFISGTTKATYSGTATGGTLSVTDGSHTASIHLTGNYLASSFITATNGDGGTLIHDPPKAHAPSPLPPVIAPLLRGQAFIQAMAGMAAPSGAPPAVSDVRMAAQPMLATPRP